MKTLTKEPIKSRISKPTDLPGVLEAFDKRWLNRFPDSRDMRYRRAKRFIDWCQVVDLELNQLDAWEIEGYLGDLSHKRGKKKGQALAVNTVRGHAQVITLLLNWVERQKILINGIEFVAPKFKAPKAPKEKVKYLKDGQVDLVIADLNENVMAYDAVNGHHMEAGPYNARNLAFVHFCLETGARPSAALGLNWGDITWNEDKNDGQAYIRHGKGDKARMMFFGPVAWKALNEYVETYHIRQGENDPVFCSIRACWKLYYEGKPLPRWSPKGVCFVFEKLTERLGVKVTSHCCAKTCLMVIRSSPSEIAHSARSDEDESARVGNAWRQESLRPPPD
jgi:integrase